MVQIKEKSTEIDRRISGSLQRNMLNIHLATKASQSLTCQYRHLRIGGRMQGDLNEISELAQRVSTGERRALARAITLVESGHPNHRVKAAALLEAMKSLGREALRIGLSGAPGAGKSTFIESFGTYLTGQGFKVAVLAIDPSSARSGGSILGDKTRMAQLSRDPAAFIRPSPSRTQLGGVARGTREAVALCEAAGFDVVLTETVGVGQSETMVAQMVDLFVLLLAPASGDELQGLKRGIVETADLILVNKADGDLKTAAIRACADYAGALRLLRRRPQDPEGFPKALMVSALRKGGLSAAWQEMRTLIDWRKAQGVWEQTRVDQMVHWFREDVRAGLIECLTADEEIRRRMDALAREVAAGTRSPTVAAQIMLEGLKTGRRSA